MVNRATGYQPIGRRSLRKEVVDLFLIALAVAVLVAEAVEDDTDLGFWWVLVSLLCCGALLFRHRYPVAVLLIAAAGRLFVFWAAESGLATLPVLAVALYTVARHGDRKVGLLTASSVAAVVALVSAALGDGVFAAELVEEGAQTFLPIAIGDAVRTRADRVNDLIEAEAEARVQAERLRIARDLHDVVAHGLSTIAIQSGVAARLLDDDREQAREALEVINATGRSSLDELRSMVGALRSSEVAERQPTPVDPDEIGDVLVGAERAGVTVVHDRRGRFPDDVGDAVVVAAHRIIQEALMNVARHAGEVRAVVRLEHGEDGVEVEVVNEPAQGPLPSVASTGVGIVGMQERAESVGGTLEAGPATDGGWRVRAWLPYRRRA
ncbi:MAG: histidine kinase [Actinomycetota bacterium]